MRKIYSLAFVLGLAFATAGKTLPSRIDFSVREEPDRIRVQWSGPVAAPMSERLGEVFRKYEDDPRSILLVLNSPGGSVAHGREVVHRIHQASRTRQIDTRVEAGHMCASMCVPIYLVGAERSAHPSAKFMFHEVSFMGRAPDIDRQMLKQVLDHATSQLFDDDMGPRSVDAKWLEKMRQQIRGRDVWLTGRQLVDQGSGVVDRLN